MLSVRQCAGVSKQVTLWRMKKMASQLDLTIPDHLYLQASKPDTGTHTGKVSLEEDGTKSYEHTDWEEHVRSALQIFSSMEGRSLQFI